MSRLHLTAGLTTRNRTKNLYKSLNCISSTPVVHNPT